MGGLSPRRAERSELEQCPNEKWMRWQFSPANRSLRVKRRELHPGFFQCLLIRRIETKITSNYPSVTSSTAIGSTQPATRDETHHSRLFHQRARQSCDEQRFRIRRRFLVFAAGNSRDVSAKFYQRVLKAAAGSQKRKSFFAGKLDRIKNSHGIYVGTTGHDPNSSASDKVRLRRTQPPRFNPAPSKIAPTRRPCQFQSPRNRAMRQFFR